MYHMYYMKCIKCIKCIMNDRDVFHFYFYLCVVLYLWGAFCCGDLWIGIRYVCMSLTSSINL